jgi:SpoVK/Ycf46/Vps4 family AAA+-type ATPase
MITFIFWILFCTFGLRNLQVSGPEVVGAVSGESELRLRMIFDDAVANAPSIVSAV